MPRQTVAIVVMHKSNWNYPLALDTLCAKGISPDEVILLKSKRVIAEIQPPLRVITTHRGAVDLALLISRQKAERNRIHLIVHMPNSLLISRCIYVAAVSFTSKDNLWEWADDDRRTVLRHHPVPRYRTGLRVAYPFTRNRAACTPPDDHNQRLFFKSLSTRLQQALHLIVIGKSNASIAATMSVSQQTANSYVSKIYGAFRDFLTGLGIVVEDIERQLIAFFSSFFKGRKLRQSA